MDARRKTWLPVLMVVALLSVSACSAALEVTRLDAPPPSLDAVDASLVHWRETIREPRLVNLYYVCLDLQDPRCEIFLMLADDPDGDGPAESILRNPVDVAARNGAMVAINTNAWRAIPGLNPQNRRGWYPGRPVDINGLVVTDGTMRSAPMEGYCPIWIDRAGRPHLGDPADPSQVQVGVSNWIDRLIVDGQVVARDENDIHPRTLIGYDAEGRHLLLAVADGRRKGVSEGLSLYEAAGIMQGYGCHNAVNLDGGGSSIMLIAEEGSTTPTIVNQPAHGVRPVPVLLGIGRRTRPPGREVGVRETRRAVQP